MQVLQLLSVLLVAIVQVSAQTVNSTLPVNNRACPEEMINFTCVVHGSDPVLTWISAEYIGGDGAQLEFGEVDIIDNRYIKRANGSSTVATLVNISESDGVTVIESQLEIIASVAGSVVCHDVSANRSQNVSFDIATKPSSSPQDVILNQSDCNLKLSWTPLEEVNHYLIIIQSGNTIITINESSNVTRYGPLVADMIDIRIAAIDRCGREGPSQNQSWSADRDKCCMKDMEPQSCTCIPTSGIEVCIGISITVGILLVITPIISVLVYCVYSKYKHICRSCKN